MPNQVESYQKVIEVISDIHFDHDSRTILLQIAKTNPQIVVDASEFVKTGGKPTSSGVSLSVMNALCAGRKIEAIKQHRLDTGLGLKDAKDVVDAVISLNPNIRAIISKNY